MSKVKKSDKVSKLKIDIGKMPKELKPSKDIGSARGNVEASPKDKKKSTTPVTPTKSEKKKWNNPLWIKKNQGMRRESNKRTA